MSPSNLREEWEAIADAIDALRIMPRLLVLGFAGFTMFTVWDLIEWYQALPGSERALEASGFGAAVIAALLMMFTKALENYHKSGRKSGGE
jgi:hypothetical protein